MVSRSEVVTVRFFAAAREAAKVSVVELELPRADLSVRELLAVLIERFPQLNQLVSHLRVAVNQEFAQLDERVPPGAEVALIPPVAGGTAGIFRVVDRPLELSEVIEAVQSPANGGLVTFSGVVRDHSKGETITRLEYEAFVPMAEKKLAELGQRAKDTWPAVEVAVVHRVGALSPGELAVVIAVAAPHRAEAFRACEWLIDRLKEEVPIWKKEFSTSGAVWVGLGP